MGNTLNIDPQTGLVQLGGFCSLKPGLTLADFLATPLGGGASELLSNQDYKSFSLGLPSSSEFAGGLTFLNERIFSLEIAKRGFATSWKDWSEEKEIRRKREHDALLEKMLGLGPYKFF